MRIQRSRVTALLSITSVILLASAIASDAAWGRGRETEAYFGELHLHTSLSTDAFMNGTRKHPVTAYRFAQGDPVVLTSGETWSLETPLDFVAVTDHSESFGDLPLCTTPGSPVYALPVCQAMRGNDPTTMGRVIGGWSVEQATLNQAAAAPPGA